MCTIGSLGRGAERGQCAGGNEGQPSGTQVCDSLSRRRPHYSKRKADHGVMTATASHHCHRYHYLRNERRSREQGAASLLLPSDMQMIHTLRRSWVRLAATATTSVMISGQFRAELENNLMCKKKWKYNQSIFRLLGFCNEIETWKTADRKRNRPFFEFQEDLPQPASTSDHVHLDGSQEGKVDSDHILRKLKKTKQKKNKKHESICSNLQLS